MVRASGESAWHYSLYFADILLRDKALEGLQPLGEVEGIEELVQVLQHLFADGGVETPDNCFLRRLVQRPDQTIDARIVALRPSVLDVIWDGWLNSPELVDVVPVWCPASPTASCAKAG